MKTLIKEAISEIAGTSQLVSEDLASSFRKAFNDLLKLHPKSADQVALTIGGHSYAKSFIFNGTQWSVDKLRRLPASKLQKAYDQCKALTKAAKSGKPVSEGLDRLLKPDPYLKSAKFKIRPLKSGKGFVMVDSKTGQLFTDTRRETRFDLNRSNPTIFDTAEKAAEFAKRRKMTVVEGKSVSEDASPFKVGDKVKIQAGKYKGKTAKVTYLGQTKAQVSVITAGGQKATDHVEFEDLTKES